MRLERKPLDQARTDNQRYDIVQMKAVQNVNKVLCQEYNSWDSNWYERYRTFLYNSNVLQDCSSFKEGRAARMFHPSSKRQTEGQGQA